MNSGDRKTLVLYAAITEIGQLQEFALTEQLEGNLMGLRVYRLAVEEEKQRLRRHLVCFWWCVSMCVSMCVCVCADVFRVSHLQRIGLDVVDHDARAGLTLLELGRKHRAEKLRAANESISMRGAA